MRYQINIYRPGRRPKRVPKPRAEERRISVAILVPLLILLLLGVSFAYMKASSSLDRKIKMNNRQKTYLQDQLKQAEMDLEKVTKERGLISQLKVKRIEWFQKLLGLSQIMPDDLWLTDLSIKTTKKQKKGAREVIEETKLTIEGVTVPEVGGKSLDSIAKLISSLNSLESFQRDFEPATLVRTHLSREKDRELMKFEISSKLKGEAEGSGGGKEKASR